MKRAQSAASTAEPAAPSSAVRVWYTLSQNFSNEKLPEAGGLHSP